MRKLIPIMQLVLLMLVPGVASAGGGGGDISACSGFATGNRVSMLDSCFDGVAHFASSGASIVVANDGVLPHTFTSADAAFDSGTVMAGDSVELTVDQPGIYQVFCSLHGTASGDGMAGVLIVGEPDPEAVASSPIDPTEIGRIVAQENQGLAESIDRQTVAIGNLSSAQASLRSSIEGIPTDGGVAPAANPPTNDSGDLTVVALIAGLGAGLALALFGLQRIRREDSRSLVTN